MITKKKKISSVLEIIQTHNGCKDPWMCAGATVELHTVKKKQNMRAKNLKYLNTQFLKWSALCPKLILTYIKTTK